MVQTRFTVVSRTRPCRAETSIVVSVSDSVFHPDRMPQLTLSACLRQRRSRAVKRSVGPGHVRHTENRDSRVWCYPPAPGCAERPPRPAQEKRFSGRGDSFLWAGHLRPGGGSTPCP